ncbi:hypothetical protein [Thiohalophilus sp.]|uniref:hypothetical protein n=1 Tax=Thiohalophilus sp. TaxID=3028392 RepID=UPI002ACF0705|nr:hypothetical protein [Thiohalophilus sp.]MDZ7662339.1 hypothetical protein [Thiohalophilus sp.]MDZ7802422.1 hypothetical protein [Thiohalophilus sp.]
MWQHHLSLLASILFALIFFFGNITGPGDISRTEHSLEGQVVITAPVQLLIFAGDRFLAANLEAIRSATITLDDSNDRERAVYRLRSHRVVAQLNPCHEDNYYMGNAVLTWGGMEEAGNDLLQRATECRFWDEYPPFFLGFNQYFFFHNIEEAQNELEKAAKRSTNNSSVFRKLAIMINAEEMNDEQMAINYLSNEIRTAQDPKLREMLEKRLVRLQGLVTLRKAQNTYEEETGESLDNPKQLITQGILHNFPQDPLNLGYEFINGEFRLRTHKIQGINEGDL